MKQINEKCGVGNPSKPSGGTSVTGGSHQPGPESSAEVNHRDFLPLCSGAKLYGILFVLNTLELAPIAVNISYDYTSPHT